MARPNSTDLKERLTVEAEAIVAAEGLEALSARRLAGAGGCSVGTLYNLFGHLDGVVRAVNRRTMTRLGRTLEEALDPTRPPEPRLTALAEAYRTFALAHPNLWDALFRHRMTTQPDRPVEPEAEALWRTLLRAAGPDADREALSALWAAVHGVVELAAGRRLLSAEPDAAGRYLARIVRAGVRDMQLPPNALQPD
ncbi:MAG: TetR-like C-terminal domain-containing protein [Pseudomonadota bacterium]